MTAQDAKGPWEVTLGLAGTQGSLLAGLGEGWLEPHQGFHDAEPCRLPNVLLRRECEHWPRGDEVRELAFAFGAMIENAWGYSSGGSSPVRVGSKGSSTGTAWARRPLLVS